MSGLIQGLVGQYVLLNSSGREQVATDSGVLEAFDGLVIRLRKGDDCLYFPIYHVHGIMRAAEEVPVDRQPIADGSGLLLRELIGQEVRIFPTPQVRVWTEGVLEDADEHVVVLRTKDGSPDGLEHSFYLPLTRIRLIKPNR